MGYRCEQLTYLCTKASAGCSLLGMWSGSRPSVTVRNAAARNAPCPLSRSHQQRESTSTLIYVKSVCRPGVKQWLGIRSLI